MLKKLDRNRKLGDHHISILYPGLELTAEDTGYYSLGRIDHANIRGGATIRMHPHVNDDILSYFRTGKVRHTDSEGFEEYITPSRLMLMKAGAIFHHEEAIQEDLEGLQIFIRPRVKDGKPSVSFRELKTVHSVDRWRLIASGAADAELQLSSDTEILDLKLTPGPKFTLPEQTRVSQSVAYLLYIFQGSIVVNQQIGLSKGDSLFISDESPNFETATGAELVLFKINLQADYYDGGMFSGNQIKKNPR